MQIILMEDSRLIAEALETSLVNYGYITKRKSYDEFLKSNCYVKDTDVLIINIDFEISVPILSKPLLGSPKVRG